MKKNNLIQFNIYNNILFSIKKGNIINLNRKKNNKNKKKFKKTYIINYQKNQ